MRKINLLLALLFIVSFSFSYAQEDESKKSEKQLFGVQTGFLGIWFHHEVKLSSQLFLRSEVGLNAGFGGGGSYNEFYNAIGITKGFATVASVSIEPRFYYNLNKRRKNGKNTNANSANFIALNTNYYPGWLVSAQNKDKVAYTQQISFTPYWGIKRTLGKHFTYEAGAGLGYLNNISIKGNGIKNRFDKEALLLYLHLRIGYTF